MKNKFLLAIFIFATAFTSCRDVSKINEAEAGDVITDYLKGNQEYKTARFNFGEMKFNSKSEMLDLEKYKRLEDEGYITMDLQEGKKKFLSKDSSFVYQIRLTEKASDLVMKQDEDKATVKVVIYELASEKPVNFNKVNDNNARVTVSLKKTNTVFAPFQRNAKDNSEFITRTYKLKLHKEEGWRVVR
ncbi:MAG: hypothetical protein EOO90_03305 [Pedobacter sp.]|nr:MAG: hypothetical protein EOO90_03305 [Pedobacter sp.]